MIPVVIATVALTAVLLIDPGTGAVVATILALPVGVVAAVAGILALRSGPRRSPVAGRTHTVVWVTTSVLTAVIALAAVGYAVLAPRTEDTSGQLTGTVRVGVSGKVPGWSLKTGHGGYEGFEVELIRHLVAKYGFTPDLIELTPGELIAALDDRRVDMVIANFSVHDARDMTVEFAGPYYVDRSGVYASPSKLNGIAPTLEDAHICSNNDARPKLSTLVPTRQPTYYDSLQDCLVEYFDPHSDTNAVMMNRAILASLATARTAEGTPCRSGSSRTSTTVSA